MTSNNLWETYQAFLTDTKTDRLAKILCKYELFKMVVDLPGDFVEGGVYRGAGLFLWAKLIQIYCPLSKRRVVGFDTFKGFPDNLSLEFDKASARKLMAQDPYFQTITKEDILHKAELLDLQDRIQLIDGNILSTAPHYVQSNPGFRIALLNLDFDNFDATLAALESLYELVVPHGIIILDEYGIRDWGESDAVDKFFATRNAIYHSIPWTFTPTAYIIKT